MFYSFFFSVAYYSGESVSYAEIGYFIPNTYAFEVNSMSARHKKILVRFSQELCLVGKADLSKRDMIIVSKIDHEKKSQTIKLGTEQDAQEVANAIISHVQMVIKPLTWMMDDKHDSINDALTLNESKPSLRATTLP